MIDTNTISILTLRLRHERHVVQARQRARDIAALLGFEHQDQIRLATATSELARNAFRYASDGIVEFRVGTITPQLFVVAVSDSGPGIPNLAEVLDGKYISKTGLGRGIIGTKRLMDQFEISSAPGGTLVETAKLMPATTRFVDADGVRNILKELAKSGAADPFDEVERQNQELLKTLAELREKQDQLAELNEELEDTNRGVVALYAELDQNADDLRRVSDLKTSFLSNLSHEFRTPLNSISSLCQMLISRSDGELSAEQEKQVAYIQRSAAELTELVNDLLDLAKVEAGKIEVRPRHFEVQDLFGSLRGMLKPLLTGNSLELIFDAESEYPPLHTDEGKLSQILRNLISNALKFTRRGYVRLSAEADATFITFRVEDTGIGIAPADLEKIFEEFTQIDSELQAKVKGTGLGLPLSRRLAELLGGSLRVESEVGIGSTFHVHVPIRYGETKDEPMKAIPASTSLAAGPTILFVEDSPETRFVHESSLKTTNFKLLFAQNIPEARAVLRNSSPALIALDRYLDGEDSLFYIRELKENGYSGPIVVISVVDEAQAALGAGADRFLAKPVAPFKLASTFHELLDRQTTSKPVLLADDDEVSRYLLAEALTRLGYSVVEARGGREAIQIMKDNILAGVFLDIVMPDLTGFEVLREIRRGPSTKTVPVIVHSSMDLTSDELDSLRNLGAVIFPKRDFSTTDDAAQLREVLATAGIGL
jgi:signal transduction histidine kinase/CheY-like chemotaxis protein